MINIRELNFWLAKKFDKDNL